MDHAEMKRQGHKDHDAKKSHHTAGGELPKQRTEAMIREAMDEHDEQQHGGKKMRLKLKTGGRVEGEEKRERLDRAKGGRTKGGHKTNINIVMPPGQDRPVRVPAMGPVAGGPPPGMMPHPPMAGPPPGAGGPPMGPPVGAGVPMPHKKGGRVRRDDGGAVVDPAAGMPVAKGGRIKKAFGGGMGSGMDGRPTGLDRPGFGAPPMPAPMGGAGGPGAMPGTVMGGPPAMPPRPPMPAPVAQPAAPPMAAPPMAGPPMGGGPAMTGHPVMAARGGKIQENAGAGSGLGRLEKTKEYGLKGSGEHENESFTEDGENKKMKRGGRS